MVIKFTSSNFFFLVIYAFLNKFMAEEECKWAITGNTLIDTSRSLIPFFESEISSPQCLLLTQASFPRKKLLDCSLFNHIHYQTCHFLLLFLLQCLSLPSDGGLPADRNYLTIFMFLEPFMEVTELDFSFPLSASSESC